MTWITATPARRWVVAYVVLASILVAITGTLILAGGGGAVGYLIGAVLFAGLGMFILAVVKLATPLLRWIETGSPAAKNTQAVKPPTVGPKGRAGSSDAAKR